ncbi:MAG: hypothetical protein WKF77_01095 [Planctomycetaceae bacterium]
MDNEDTRGRSIGKLSSGWNSHQEIMDLAQSFVSTVIFLDAVEHVLKRVDAHFELRKSFEDGELSFLPRSTNGGLVVGQIESQLEFIYLAWKLASNLYPDVTLFNGDTLKDLKNVLRSREDIFEAFHRVDDELSMNRARYELVGVVSDEKGHRVIAAELAPGLTHPFLGLVFHHDSTVSRLGDEYKGTFAALSPQGLVLLKFIHAAGERGRTKPEIIPAVIANAGILKSEKNRLNDDLIPLDLNLGPRSQYILTCCKRTSVT